MKARDLKERSSDDLVELQGVMRKDLFSYRMKNFTSQLDDTSLLRKTRRDIARVESILSERRRVEQGAAAEGGES